MRVLRRAAACLTLLAGAGSAGATPVFLTPVNISDAGQDGFEGVGRRGLDRHQVHYAWTRSDGTNTRIQYRSRDVSGNFGAVQTISDPGQNASDPDIAVDPSNNVLLAWSRTRRHEHPHPGRLQAGRRRLRRPADDLRPRVRRDQARGRFRQLGPRPC